MIRKTRRQVLASALAVGGVPSLLSLGSGGVTARSNRQQDEVDLVLRESWPMYQQNAGHTGYSGNLSGPTENVDSGTFTIASSVDPIVVEDSLISVTDGGANAQSVTNGDTQWTHSAGNVQASAAVVDDFTILQNGGRLLSLRPGGGVRWSTSVSVGAGEPPTVSGNNVILTDGRRVAAYEADTGDQKWETRANSDALPAKLSSGMYIPDGSRIEERTDRFAQDVGGEILSLAGSGKELFAATGANEVAHVERFQETPLQWTVGLEGRPNADMAVGIGSVYVGDDTGTVYAIGSNSGRISWTLNVESPVTANVAVTSGTVYVGTQDGTLHAIDTTEGTRRWSAAVGSPVDTVAVADGRVYADNYFVEGYYQGSYRAIRELASELEDASGDTSTAESKLDEARSAYENREYETAYEHAQEGLSAIGARTTTRTATPTTTPRPETPTTTQPPTTTPTPTTLTPTTTTQPPTTTQPQDDPRTATAPPDDQDGAGGGDVGGGSDGEGGSGGLPLRELAIGGGGVLAALTIVRRLRGGSSDSTSDVEDSGEFRYDGDDTDGSDASSDTTPSSGSDTGAGDAATGGSEAARTTAEKTSTEDDGTPSGPPPVTGSDGIVSTLVGGTHAGLSRGDHSPPRADELRRDIPALESADFVGSTAAFDVYQGTLDGRDGDLEIAVARADVVDDERADDAGRAIRQWGATSTHPNVVTVVENGADPRPWLATRPVEGWSFADRPDGLSVDARLDLLVDVSEAVRNGGRYNVRHLSLTPETVVTDTAGSEPTALVGDWGVQDALLPDRPTTPFDAPEQLDGRDTGEATDVYRIGALVYETMADRPPFADAEDLDVAIREGELTPPTELDGDLPAALDDVVETAMATEPTERYGSLFKLQQALKQI